MGQEDGRKILIWTTLLKLPWNPELFQKVLWEQCSRTRWGMKEHDCGSSEFCDCDPCCLPGCILKSGVYCLLEFTGPCCIVCHILPASGHSVENIGEWMWSLRVVQWNFMWVSWGCVCSGWDPVKGCWLLLWKKRCKYDDQWWELGVHLAVATGKSTLMLIILVTVESWTIHIWDVIAQTSSVRVQCEKVTDLSFLRSHHTEHWTYVNGVTC